MGKPLQLEGKRFGRLTVLRRNLKNLNDHPIWDCICDCGNKISVRANNLLPGAVKSCGCYRRDRMKKLRTTHGMTGTRIYWRWKHVLKKYRQGIPVIKRWLKFNNFYKDIGDVKEGYTIKRKDKAKGYSNKNCVLVKNKKKQDDK